MSIHPSLSASAKAKKIRSVLKRAERLKIMMDKDEWKEGQSIFSLPKIKTLRLKIKKEKAAAATAAAEAGAEGEKAVQAPEAKEAKPAKEAKSASATAKSTKSSPQSK